MRDIGSKLSHIAAFSASCGIAWLVYYLLRLNIDPALSHGLAAAGVTTIGIILLHYLRRWQWSLAGVLLVLAIFLGIGGFWYSLDAWGISDWDYYFSVHHNIRQSLLTYHTFPFWNPYTCGGTAGLGDPEFSLFTPSFALELFFGVERGLRLAIFLTTITGGLGMLVLAKRIGLSVYAAIIASLVFALGSVNLLEVVEGHPNVFAAGWIPWVFWAWLAAYRASTKSEARNQNQPQGVNDQNSKWFRLFGFGKFGFVSIFEFRYSNFFSLWPLVCGIFLALTFYQGGIYLLMYTTLAFVVLPWLTSQPWRAYLATVYAGIWALGLAALKLMPVLLWLREFQDNEYASSVNSLLYLPQILFGRYLHGAQVIPDQGSGWHEYGAYIGIMAGLLALIGTVRFTKSRLVRALVITAIVTAGLSSSGPLLKPFFDHASFFPRSNISRFILFTVIPLALLAGTGLDVVRQRVGRLRPLLVALFLAVAAGELMTLAYALSLQAFVLPRVIPAVSPAPKPLAYIAHDYKIRYQGDDYSRSYAATLAGYGTLNYCSPLTPPTSIRTIHDEENNAIVALDSALATFILRDWSPNHISVDVNSPEPTSVILNTNYAKGWTANGGAAREIAGRVGTNIDAGSQHVVFRYQSPGWRVGLVMTLLSLVAAIFVCGRYLMTKKYL